MTTETEPATETPPALDEQSRRRPDFVEGVPVALANGQEWHFPKPQVRIRPRIEGGKVLAVSGSFTHGGDYDKQLAAFHEAADGGDQAVQMFAMAVGLLSMNYTLSDDELGDLLSFVVGTEAGDAMRQELVEVVLGTSPKLTPDGDS